MVLPMRDFTKICIEPGKPKLVVVVYAIAYALTRQENINFFRCELIHLYISYSFSTMGKILILCTSAGSFTGGPTGLWLEELACPYYLFKEAGHEVTVTSVSGGAIPIDAGSMGAGFFTDACKKFLHDPEAVGALCHTLSITDCKASSYDVVYVAGGHGCCTDMADNNNLTSILEGVLASGKILAADCHGPMCLAAMKKPDGSPLVAGLTVTGFSDSEEAAVGNTDKVPFLIEARFKELGANYVKGDDWNPKACEDGNLITGQNPQSSEACAKLVLARL